MDRGAWRARVHRVPRREDGHTCTHTVYLCCTWLNLELLGVSADTESARNEGELSSIPGLGRSPGEGKGYPLQYSGLENSIVHGVSKSRT